MNENRRDDGDLRDALSVLYRRKLLVLGTIAVFLAVAFTFAKAQDPVYEAQVSIVVRPVSALPVAAAPEVVPDRKVSNEVDFLTGDEVRDAVTLAVGPHPDIETEVAEGADTILITAEGESGEQAAATATAYAATYLELRSAALQGDLAAAIAVVQQRLAEIDAELAALPPALAW
jgi:hypothetical protein